MTLADVWPQPSGWRARCTCGAIVRGHDRDAAETEFLAHCAIVHLIDLEPEDDQ